MEYKIVSKKSSNDDVHPDLKLLSLKEASKILGYKSPWRLALRYKSGELPGFKVAGKWVIREKKLLEYMEAREQEAMKLQKVKELIRCPLAKKKAANITKRVSPSLESEYNALRNALIEQKRKNTKTD